jgi:proline iminopeptidase
MPIVINYPIHGWRGRAKRSGWLTVPALLLVGCSALADRPSQSQRETVFDSVAHIESREVAVPDVPRLDDAPSLRRRRVDIGGGTHLYVVEEGTGPTLVLVNGGPGNTLHSFLPHFSAAASFAHVVYYDQRGTGLSDWVPSSSGYSTAQTVDDLERLRLALGVDRWFVLGHSYGGVIAQWYAIRHAEHLLGLVLVGSSVPIDGLDLGERDYRSDAERQRIREVYAIEGQAVVPVHSEQVNLATLRRMIYNGYLNGDWKRQFFFKPSLQRMAQIARYEWVHDRDYNRQVRRDGFARNLQGVFRDFPIPTLIVEGAYDANWGSDKPRLLAAQHPNAELVVVEGSSHFPFAEQPETFFTELEAFVRDASSVDPARVAEWYRSVGER